LVSSVFFSTPSRPFPCAQFFICRPRLQDVPDLFSFIFPRTCGILALSARTSSLPVFRLVLPFYRPADNLASLSALFFCKSLDRQGLPVRALLFALFFFFVREFFHPCPNRVKAHLAVQRYQGCKTDRPPPFFYPLINRAPCTIPEDFLSLCFTCGRLPGLMGRSRFPFPREPLKISSVLFAISSRARSANGVLTPIGPVWSSRSCF